MITERDINLCVRCGEDKKFNRLNNEILIYCKKCACELADEQYLDDGSDTIIKERADRAEEGISADYAEQDKELDDMLEEFEC